MVKEAKTYHIVGGGISGLFCAQIIKQKFKNSKVFLYEAASHLGGKCYSYQDESFGFNLDNATHVIIGANRNLKKFVLPKEWEPDIGFWNVSTNDVSYQYKPHISHLLKSACNTNAENVSSAIKNNILRQTFPWGYKQRKIYFSKQDLSQRIVNNLASFPDNIKYNCCLQKIETQFGRAAQLVFNNFQVELGADDKVILALDNRAYSKLMGESPLPHSSIINIFYHTSEKIYLPRNASVIGIVNGISDWVFVNGNILSVTISAANNHNTSLSELAHMVWQELDILRGVNSAFVPPFRAFKHKYATIMQDEYTNSLRPDNCLSIYPNVYIAGDWTMKNHPCCLETSYRSAQRAVRIASK